MSIGKPVIVVASIGIYMTVGAADATMSNEMYGVESTASTVHCTPADNALEELSGLAWFGDGGYAISDSGSDDRLAVLDVRCQVSRWIEIDFPTTDIEDLALDHTGTVWLADTGDNGADRKSVALIGIDPSTGQQNRLPLTYVDGAHDVEALLLTDTGAPVLITKEDDGPATVYTAPEGVNVSSMSSETPTVLSAVGTVQTEGRDGKVRPITGAAVSVDGERAALRTKKDVFIYSVPDRDVVTALAGAPAAVIDAPDQPQGEAVSFTDTGDLLLASEADGHPMPPIYKVARAVDFVQTSDDPPTSLWLPALLAVAGVSVAILIRRPKPSQRSGSASPSGRHFLK